MKTGDTTPRLVRFRIDHPSLPPPLNTFGTVTVDRPDARLEGWGLAVRGAAVFLISPRGWQLSAARPLWNSSGPVTAIGPIPMAHVTLVWEGDDASIVDKLQRFDLPPMVKSAPAPEEKVVLDAKELGDA